MMYIKVSNFLYMIIKNLVFIDDNKKNKFAVFKFRNNLISNTKKLGVTDASTRIINEILKLVK